MLSSILINNCVKIYDKLIIVVCIYILNLGIFLIWNGENVMVNEFMFWLSKNKILILSLMWSMPHSHMWYFLKKQRVSRYNTYQVHFHSLAFYKHGSLFNKRWMLSFTILWATDSLAPASALAISLKFASSMSILLP